MAGNRTLKLSLLTDDKKFSKGLDSGESRLKRFGSSAAKVGKMAAVGLAAAGAGALVLGNKLWKAGEAAVTADARTRQIAESMGLFGEQAGQVADRLSKLAEKTALQTGMDRNSIKATQAKLLTFSELAKTADVAGGAFDRANQAALDLAAAGFGTAETNAAQLGKALNDPIKGLASLGESGVTFTQVEKERIQTLVESNKMGEAQEIVLAAIEKQVGGTAAATADGSAKMSQAFGLVQDKIGKKLVPIMDKLATWVTEKVLPAFEQWTAKYGPLVAEWFTKVGATVNRLRAWFVEKLLPAAMSLWSWISGTLIPGFRGYLAPIIEGVRSVIGTLTSKLGENSGAFSKVWTVIQTLVGFLVSKVMPIIGKVAGTTLKVLGTALGVVIDTVGWLIDKIATLVEWFGKVVSAVGRALGPLKSFVDTAGKALNAAGNVASNVGGAVSRFIPGLAHGGVVTAPTLAVVGEGREPEAVLPLSKLDRMLNGTGGGTTINVTGTMLDPEGVARAVERVLRDSHRRHGGRAA